MNNIKYEHVWSGYDLAGHHNHGLFGVSNPVGWSLTKMRQVINKYMHTEQKTNTNQTTRKIKTKNYQEYINKPTQLPIQKEETEKKQTRSHR